MIAVLMPSPLPMLLRWKSSTWCQPMGLMRMKLPSSVLKHLCWKITCNRRSSFNVYQIRINTQPLKDRAGCIFYTANAHVSWKPNLDCIRMRFWLEMRMCLLQTLSCINLRWFCSQPLSQSLSQPAPHKEAAIHDEYGPGQKVPCLSICWRWLVFL